MFATALLFTTSALYAEAIGGYAAGCLKNGVSLPLTGPGYQVIRTKRLRYYGHPDLIHYLQGLAIAATRPASMPTSGSGWQTAPSANGSRTPPRSGR